MDYYRLYQQQFKTLDASSGRVTRSASAYRRPAGAGASPEPKPCSAALIGLAFLRYDVHAYRVVAGGYSGSGTLPTIKPLQRLPHPHTITLRYNLSRRVGSLGGGTQRRLSQDVHEVPRRLRGASDAAHGFLAVWASPASTYPAQHAAVAAAGKASTLWQIDEIAETLMPFLADGGQAAGEPEGQEPQGQEGHAGGIDVNGPPIVVHHADVVNVYNAPVTINNYLAAAPKADTSEKDGIGEEVVTE